MIRIVITALTLLFLSGCRPPETVEYVELERYLGLWYEIGAYPMRFQEGCTASTAEYTLDEDDADVINVTNRCRDGSPDGPLRTDVGVARVTDTETNAKLSVSFGFPAPYWIIDLDPSEGDEPYEWAVVSERTKRFLWILSRAPTLDDDILDGILERLEAQGYDLDRIRWTDHGL